MAYLESTSITTSVTFPDDLLRDIDRLAKDRSAFLVRAARRYLAELARSERSASDAADTDVYDRHAKQLNLEAADVLEFQSLPD